MSSTHRPVFVDPSGRRRRVVRAVAAIGAALTVGYLGLVLLAAFGGPQSPAARLPLLPDRPPAAGPEPAPANPAAEPPTTERGATAGPAPTATRPAPSTSATEPTAPTTTEHRGRPTRTDSPGNGRPTDPPGRGR